MMLIQIPFSRTLTCSNFTTFIWYSYNLGHKCWKMLLSAHFAPPTPVQCWLNTFHVTKVCILLFYNIERGDGVQEAVFVGFWSWFDVFGHFPTHFLSKVVGQFMFAFKNFILPRKFENIFMRNNQIHSYNTRHADSFRLPLCRTNIRQFSVFYKGPKVFNSFSPKIAGFSSLESFGKRLKISIISNY